MKRTPHMYRPLGGDDQGLRAGNYGCTPMVPPVAEGKIDGRFLHVADMSMPSCLRSPLHVSSTFIAPGVRSVPLSPMLSRTPQSNPLLRSPSTGNDVFLHGTARSNVTLSHGEDIPALAHVPPPKERRDNVVGTHDSTTAHFAPAGEVLQRKTLPQRSVFVFGYVSTPTLLADTSELLRVLRSRCGSVLAALRFPSFPPAGIRRPAYSSTVFLIVFDSVDAAVSARRLDGERVGHTRINIREAAQFALTAVSAEACLSTFLSRSTISTRGQIIGGKRRRDEAHIAEDLLSPSARLWTLLLSEVSPFQLDWVAAKAAADRGDAYVIDEARAVLSPNVPYDEPFRPTAEYCGSATAGSHAASRLSEPSSAEAMRRSSHLPTSSAPCFLDTSSTLQQMYYREKYGSPNRFPSSRERRGSSALAQAVSSGLHSVMSNLASRGEPLLHGTRGQTPLLPGSLGPSFCREDHSDKRGEALRYRRLEHAKGADTAESPWHTEESRHAFPRLSTVGSAISWLPGIQYVLPLLWEDEDDGDHCDGPLSSCRTGVPDDRSKSRAREERGDEWPPGGSLYPKLGLHGGRGGSLRVYPDRRGDVVWTTQTFAQKFATPASGGRDASPEMAASKGSRPRKAGYMQGLLSLARRSLSSLSVNPWLVEAGTHSTSDMSATHEDPIRVAEPITAPNSPKGVPCPQTLLSSARY